MRREVDDDASTKVGDILLSPFFVLFVGLKMTQCPKGTVAKLEGGGPD